MNMKKFLSMMTVVALATGSAAAMTADEAKAFMTESRTQFLSATSYYIEYTTTAMGIPTESKCWIRRDAKKGVSIRNESQPMPFGFAMPKVTQLVTGGRVYLLAAIAPKKALHMKFSDGQVPDDIFCNFFTENGTVEPISDAKDKCVIKFTPTAAELLQMGERMTSAASVLPIPKGFVPAAFRYTFLKKTKDISEIACEDREGKVIVHIAVTKLEHDIKIDDARFVLPKDCKVIDINSAAESAKALAEGFLPKK